MNKNTARSNTKFRVLSFLLIAGLYFQATEIVTVQADQLQQQNGITAVSALISGCPMFPANNIWNTPVNNLPVHARSDQWINMIGRTTGFHMDFGSGTWDGGPIGIPYNIVSGSVPKVSVSFYYPTQSDSGPYPIPNNPLTEYGSDHHILIVDNSTCTLYELFDASYSGGAWHAGSGAIWSLNSNVLRPDTWTSADAAGLPILPGLVRYDEIVSSQINHALRFTAENTNGYIWPARHLTSNDPGAPQIPPMGARFRLKASFNITGYPPAMQVILNAMKTYGIILADNGSNWYVSGTPDERWDNDMLHLLDDLTGNDFEAVDTSGLMVNYDSGLAQITTPADVQAFIAGSNVGTYSIPFQSSMRPSYTGIDSGPVKVQSMNNIPIVAALRDLWSGGGNPSSSIQLMGLPENQLSDTYWFPAYNNVSLDDQLRFGNVGTSATTVTVTIGGVVKGTYPLNPSQSVRINYPGVDSGPVKVQSSGGVKIIASIRDSWNDGTKWSSYSQLMGLPNSQLSDTYLFSAYNNVSLDDQLRFGNVGTAPTQVTVTIGGIVRGTYTLNPNQSFRVRYNNLDSGPVKVQSSGGVKIIASIRDAWHDGTKWTSYFQLMGLPASQVSDTYVFPAYDNVTLDGQLRFGNVGTAPTTVTVTINGVVEGTYPLNPNQSVRVNYTGLDSGPVKIESSGGVKIIACLRDAWFDGTSWTSYSQLMGLPGGQLTTSYYFPAYNNVTYDNQLRIAVP